MRALKKIVSMVMISIFMIGAVLPVSADEPIKVIENSANVCVVREYTAEGMTIATNNKKMGVLLIEKYDVSGKYLLSSEQINLNSMIQAVSKDASKNELATSVQGSTRAGSTYIYQHTISNREYDIMVSPAPASSYWEVRCGNNKKARWSNSSNSGRLENFRNAVNQVNAAEIALAGVVGWAVAVVAIALLTSQGGAAAAAAVGGIPAATAAIGNISSSITNADYWFATI